MTTKELRISETVRKYWEEIGYEPDDKTKITILLCGILPLGEKIKLLNKYILFENPSSEYNDNIKNIINCFNKDIKHFKYHRINTIFILKLDSIDDEKPFCISTTFDAAYTKGIESKLSFTIYKSRIDKIVDDIRDEEYMSFTKDGIENNMYIRGSKYDNVVYYEFNNPITLPLPFYTGQKVMYENKEWDILAGNTTKDNPYQITITDESSYNSRLTLHRGTGRYYIGEHVDPLYLDVLK